MRLCYSIGPGSSKRRAALTGLILPHNRHYKAIREQVYRWKVLIKRMLARRIRARKLARRIRARKIRARKQGLDPGMTDWGLGEKSALSIGGSGFRDWAQDRYAELVLAVKHQEDVAFRPVEPVLSSAAILARLAEQMECSPSAFITRSHRQPYRPFAAYFLTRFGGLTRREVARHLGVSSGPAVTQQIARYGQMIAESRRWKNVAKQCEAALKDAASGVA